jgi:hypothetical protein
LHSRGFLGDAPAFEEARVLPKKRGFCVPYDFTAFEKVKRGSRRR